MSNIGSSTPLREKKLQLFEMIKSCGEEVPDWITDMLNSGAKSFYIFEDGKKKFYDINTKTFLL